MSRTKAVGAANALPRLARSMEIWPIARPQLDPQNAKTHPAEQLERLRAAIRRFGYTQPLLVDEHDVLIACEARLVSARAERMPEITVIVLAGLSPAERRAYAIADNRIGELGEWNEERLAAALEEAQREGIELECLGFSDAELADLASSLDPASTSAPAGADVVPEQLERVVSREGDVWNLGEHVLMCADSTDDKTWKRLLDADVEKAACVFTDPPYGISYESAAGARVANDELAGERLVALLVGALSLVSARARDDAAFYVWHAWSHQAEFETALARVGLRPIQPIVWIKPSATPGHGDYQWSHEMCIYAAKDGERPRWHGGRDQATVWRVSIDQGVDQRAQLGSGVEVYDAASGATLWLAARPPKGRKARRITIAPDGRAIVAGGANGHGASTAWEVSRDHDVGHPTPKPVELVRRALENSTRAGEIVVDPFNGSGSMILACELTGRLGRAADLEPRWIDLTIRRWQTLTGRAATLASAKKRRTFEQVQAERASS